MRKSLEHSTALTGAEAALRKLRKEFTCCQIPLHAGSAVFFLTLSVLPAAALLLGLIQMLPPELSAQLRGAFTQLPEEATAFLAALLSVGDPVAVVSFSALTALWAASRGIYGIMLGLNRAFSLAETRSWLRTRTSCMADTLLLLILIPGILLVAGAVSTWLPGYLIRLPILLASSLLILRALPDHRPGILYLLPGAVFTSVSWLIFSRVYRFYLETLSPGRLTGGLSDATVTLLWLYFCIELLFCGALLCRLAANRKGPQDR